MSETNDQVEVAVYGRNSDDQQSTSQEIQNDEFANFATTIAPQMFGGRTARIVESYADHGKSGSKRKQLHKRTDFRRLLDDMADGRIGRTGERFPEFIVVLNTSRFSRLHPIDTSDLYKQIRNAGCKLVTIEDRRIIDPDECHDFFMAMLKAQQDNEYSKTLAGNVLRGVVKACKEGKNTGSSVPFGMARLIVDEFGDEKVIPRLAKYRKSRDAQSYLIPGDETEQEVIRFLFKTFADKEMSYHNLSRILNQHDQEAYRVGPHGNGWTQQTLQGILRNAHLAGYEFKGNKRQSEYVCIDNGSVTSLKNAGPIAEAVIVDVTLPDIGHDKQGCVVDRDVWDKVQTRMDKRKSTKKRICNRVYALSSILYCSCCGKPLYPHKHGKYVRYWCKASASKQSECQGWGVKEAEILPAILQLIDGEIWKSKTENPPAPKTDTEEAKKLTKLNNTIQSLKDRIRTADPEAVESLHDALENALSKRKQLIKANPTDTIRRHQYLVDHWDEFTKPNLIHISTTKPGETFSRIAPIFKHWEKHQVQQLADEADRLLNTAHLEPSAVRSVLQDLDVRIDFTFKARQAKKRRFWDIDTAAVRIGGQNHGYFSPTTSPVHRAAGVMHPL